MFMQQLEKNSHSGDVRIWLDRKVTCEKQMEATIMSHDVYMQGFVMFFYA